MVYLRTVFTLIACKEASLFGVDSCACTSASTFYKLLEIERTEFDAMMLPDRSNGACLEQGKRPHAKG